ncbi:hypothetical protein KSP39_PZI023727 [Platanthera zijinensis]|uniref:Uncharacterized protein n=1 Tax=Platanthera zijinensis TaxID=2320716 RepID=A0AAP0ATR2_9ASPA
MDSQNGSRNFSETRAESSQQNSSSGTKKPGDHIPIYIPAIDIGLLPHSRRNGKKTEDRFLDFLKARPSSEWFSNLLRRNIPPPANESSSSSPSDPAADLRRRPRFRALFARSINCRLLWRYFERWIKSPEHIALFVWSLFVAAGLITLFLVMTGILDGAIPSSSRRKDWAEIINQILNAFFTMMALYEHPKIFHHTVLLFRWRNGDEAEVRKVYSKNGDQKPHERAHMMIVVTLLHITCLSQYALCGLYWGFTRKTRAEWAENLSIGVGIAAPVLAVVYTMYSPLGRTDGDPPRDEAELVKQRVDPAACEERIVITSPEWIGGAFDCGDDAAVICLSFFCTFCVFGWNAERLGFGNMYVHIVTFALLCIAPFWIFAISALNVRDDTVKLIVVIAGSVICVLGLLYGGFWRVKMRKKFKLPGNVLCCGSSTITDYIQWLFCWACSLAQEVRTANFYDIEEDEFCGKATDEKGREVLIALPREGDLNLAGIYGRSLSCPTATVGAGERPSWPIAVGRAATDTALAPPPPSRMSVEEEQPLRNVELSDQVISK